MSTQLRLPGPWVISVRRRISWAGRNCIVANESAPTANWSPGRGSEHMGEDAPTHVRSPEGEGLWYNGVRIHGGRSVAVNASGCGPEDRGFDPLRSPHKHFRLLTVEIGAKWHRIETATRSSWRSRGRHRMSDRVPSATARSRRQPRYSRFAELEQLDGCLAGDSGDHERGQAEEE